MIKARGLEKRLDAAQVLAGLDFDDDLETSPALLRMQHQVGIQGVEPQHDRNVLLSAGVHPCVVLAPALAVQQPDNAVVLELFADGPHQNRAHLAPPSIWILTVGNSEW